MKKNWLRSLCISALLAIALSPALAEDIDLFTGVNTNSGGAPNVLFVLDNTANWTQPFTAEIQALVEAFESMPADKFRVGVMMFSETGSGDSTADGAYVRAAIRLMDSGTRTKYATLLGGLGVGADKSNGGKAGKTMVEAYRYFTGAAPYAGNNKVKTDYAGNTSGTVSSNAVYALAGNALSAKGGSPYVSPIDAACGNSYIIYISNGAVQDNVSDTKAATDELKAAGGDATPLVISPSGSQDNVADEWARFMRKSLGVSVYTIEAAKASGGQGPGWSAMLKSMAGVSSGKYFDVSDSTDLRTDLKIVIDKVLSEIQSVNSVFSSVTLPVSANTQGTYLNQVFIGMFRPDQDALPRWNGNLKQYKLGLDASSNLILQDAAGSDALNYQTGFISECARSFWTPTTADNYWAFRPAGTCIGSSDASNTPDGNIVEKGAQAYVLRSSPSRVVRTCAAGSCTTLTDFSVGNSAIDATALGAADATERGKLINWARGLNVKGDELSSAIAATDMRPSAHGDVVHSRPVAVNYGTDAAPQVVVFYGGNDGMLRAINGNRSATLGSAAAGSELWAFMPPEFYRNIKRLYDNSTLISFPGVTGTPTPAPKPYGMDGSVAAYQQGSSVWLYAAMRRGGRMLYAFDVSSPASPSLKWRKGCPNLGDDIGCDAGFSGMGQTWSTPKLIKSTGYGSGAAPMLVFGGGYDRCEDADINTCSAATKGNKVYVLDAGTGALLNAFDTERAVIGEVAVVSDSLGLAKHAYAADLGGNVYRIAMGSGAPSAWTMSKIAALGCDGTGTCSANRKFMFMPDVVEDNGAFVLLLGSGDREKPVRSYASTITVPNRFYMLVDRPADSTWLSAEASNCGGAALLCHASLLAITGTATPPSTDLATKKGWYLALASEEQVVTASVTAYGVTTFSTHTPTNPAVSNSCRADRGTAKTYNVSYVNASPRGDGRFEVAVGGGLAPSPVAGRVRLDDGRYRDVVIGADPRSFLRPRDTNPASAFRQPKGRVYWFIQK